ncbi:hypothetical protein BV898_08358 [Hypsibius exemplaris]|uniref:Ig-like domain-containing protein n=1 Tax=Hypsibius exemplaris TaxID=2072580 RepID=A0A1W0WR08_HYPEX|nr:hypothetical protein BV898_08358 [Hypsibius exemplaris]
MKLRRLFNLAFPLVAVIIASLISSTTCAAALTTSLIGPEVALLNSPTIVFKCSWLSDDLVYRIFWRVQPTYGPLLEQFIKNSVQEDPIPLAKDRNGTIQGEIAVDSRNNFSTLTVRNSGFAAEGNYSCSVSSVTAEKLQSRSLRIIAPPDQIISRLNLTTNNSSFLGDGSAIGPYVEGSSFEINCFVAQSRPPANIRWFRKDLQGQLFSLDAQSGPQKQQMDPATGVWRSNRAMYFRLDGRHLMGNLLICQAENEATVATSQPVQMSYRVDMLVPPTNITMSSVSKVQLREGMTYNLTCEAWNAKPFAALTWTLDREPVTRFVRNDTVANPDGTSTTRSVFMYTVNPDDNGKALSCIATQEVLTIQRRGLAETAMLNINYSPRNVMTSKTVLSVVEGRRPDTDSNGGINCTADANPPAQYIWTYQENVISTGPTLLFGHNVSREESGEFICVASNEMGQTNITLHVDVQYRPYCARCANASDPCLVGASLGQSPRITCEMAANPATDLTYTWNVNRSSEIGVDGDADEDFSSLDPSLSSSSQSTLPAGTASPAINYTVRTNDDYHRLHCWARNNIGTSALPCYYRVVPAGPPHPPENCSVVTVSASGFTLNCLPGFDGGHPQRFVLSVWQTGLGLEPATDGPRTNTKSLTLSGAPRSQNIIEPEIQENPFPEWMEKGLQAGRDYRLKIVARNEAGNSPPVFLALRTLKVDEAPSALSTTVIAAIAGSLGGFAFLVLAASAAYLCVRRSRKKGESSTAGSETHSNSSGGSSGAGSKSELVKETGGGILANGRGGPGGHPDAGKNGADAGSKIASLRFHQNGGMKPENPVAEITYTRACDLQSRKPSVKPVLAPKPPVIPSLTNGGRSADRTQYAVIDVTKAGKRPAPRPDDHSHVHDLSPQMPPRSNGAILHDSSSHGIIKTVAVV